jgi:hypothetical protein
VFQSTGSATRLVERDAPERSPSKAPSLEEKRIHLMKLSEALCDYIHGRQVRLRTLVEEGEDRGGECSP